MYGLEELLRSPAVAVSVLVSPLLYSPQEPRTTDMLDLLLSSYCTEG